MKQKKIKSLLLAGVITLAASMFAGCTEYTDDPAEFTTENIVINYTDSVIDASISSGSRTRSVPESTEIGSSVLTSKTGKKMYLSCTEAPWPVEKAAVTRGAKVTTVGISNMGVSASVYGSSSSYTSAGCGSYFYKESVSSGTPTRFYWPTADYKISFFGYYPYNNAAFTVQSSASTTGTPTYSYTVPSAIASQQDIMTGQVVDRLGGSASAVNMTLSHRCAAVRFSITNDRSEAITVNSISIEGVKYTGTLSGNTWTLGSSVNSSSTNPFTLTCNTSVAAGATVDITGTNNMFLMLPQTLPAGAKLLVTTDNDEFEANLTGAWVQSNSYSYSINITEDNFIDLGLPSGLLWAKRNIGAESIENKGKYFMWGNIDGYHPEDRYVWNNSNYASTTGSTLTEDIKPNATEDAARAIMGGVWRIPTRSEYDELVNGTDQEWLAINGIYGRKFMKKTNHSVFIFLPAGENGNGSTQPSGNTWCNYWSSSYDSSETAWAFRSSSSAVIKTSSVVGYEGRRYLGFNIRAVCDIYYPGRNGAFVYTTDDKFYTAEEWTVALSAGTVSNDDVVGVAVISGEHRFVIDKTDANSGNIMKFGGYLFDLSGIGVVCTSNSAEASLDFDGVGNTTKIISALAGYTDSYNTTGAPAAETCRAAFNGTGYLGALGEWALVYDKKDAINSLLTLVGGTTLSAARYKTSTLYSASVSSWRIRMSNKEMSERQRHNEDLVRAFKAI